MGLFGTIIETVTDGLLAFINGVERAMGCPQMRSSYAKFTIQCFVVMILGYIVVSATTLMVLPILFIIALGPIAGPLVFAILCNIALVTLLVLWAFDRFPYGMFVGSVGLLQPLFSVPQMSFLLCSILVPSIDEFMLLGTDIIHKEQREKRNNNNNNNNTSRCMTGNNPIRNKYIKPSLWATLSLAVNNFVFTLLVRTAIQRILFGFLLYFVLNPETKLLLDSWVITSFLLGSQLASVYTVRIRQESFWDSHIWWCFQNALRIIAFTLPMQIIQDYNSWFYSFIWLGLTYFAASSLMEQLIIQDLQSQYSFRETPSARVY